MTARGFTVRCADHGNMLRDEVFDGWACPDPACGAWLPDTEVHRRVTSAPESADPVPVVAR
jgi:hypothetical protein